MKEIETEKSDRISYSFGMKVGLPNYSSVDFHISYSTDVKDGETVAKALKRAQQLVEDAADAKYEEVKELR